MSKVPNPMNTPRMENTRERTPNALVLFAFTTSPLLVAFLWSDKHTIEKTKMTKQRTINTTLIIAIVAI